MQKNINSILMRTVAVLLMLVLLSTAMVTGRYARYTSSASGEDSARVAKFDIVTDQEQYAAEFSKTIHPGETVDMTVALENRSEVAVTISFTVNNVHDNLPLEFIYPVTAVMAPGDTGNIPLKVHWPAENNSTDYCGRVDLLKISMTVVQVD